MFGQRQAKTDAGAKVIKLHSVPSMMRGRDFVGRFEVGSTKYRFTYSPATAEVVGSKLQLSGNLTVTGDRPNIRVSPHNLRDVRATLLATQGAIGTAPQRQTLPAEISTSRPDLPIIESTGSLSFCGVLYLKLSPLEGRALGVPADMRQVQLNVRMAPVSDAERSLQAVFSSIADALYGEKVDRTAADGAVSELNKLLTA
jgi:hypothetical protein